MQLVKIRIVQYIVLLSNKNVFENEIEKWKSEIIAALDWKKMWKCAWLSHIYANGFDLSQNRG